MTTTDRIVVGLDGSPGSAAAFAAAHHEATRRRCPVDVVHGWLVTDPGLALPGAPRLDEATEESIRKALHQHVEELLGDRMPVTVHEHVHYGYPGRVLVRAARDAELLVVGSRGRGPMRGALLGSVSQYVLERARCPVMVVHTSAADLPARVVAGVDGSAASLNALRWAYRHARRDDLPLVAVHAGAPVYSHYYPMTSMLAEGWEGPRVAAERLDTWLVQELGPEAAAAVERVVDNGSAARMLLDRTGRSDLIVLGRRGTGGIDDLLMGSVARRVAAHAAGSVVIVP